MTADELYVKEISKIPRLTREEEQALFEELEKGNDKARDKIINSYLYLVVQVATKYIGNNLELSDLIQEGTFGLMKALDKFDIRKGFYFSTYAVYWVRLSIQRAIQNNGRIVRLPSYMLEIIDKMNRYIGKYINSFGVEPTEEEIANELHIPIKKVKECLNIYSDKGGLSADDDMKDDGNTSFLEMIEDSSLTPEEFTIQKESFGKLYSALNQLNEKERKILELKFGFVDGRQWTFEEIGNLFGITRQGCQWLEKGAKNKLKQILNEMA